MDQLQKWSVPHTTLNRNVRIVSLRCASRPFRSMATTMIVTVALLAWKRRRHVVCADQQQAQALESSTTSSDTRMDANSVHE